MENKNEVIKTEEELYYPVTEEVSNGKFGVTPKVLVGGLLVGAGAALATNFIITKLMKRRMKKILKKFKEDVEIVEPEEVETVDVEIED